MCVEFQSSKYLKFRLKIVRYKFLKLRDFLNLHLNVKNIIMIEFIYYLVFTE